VQSAWYQRGLYVNTFAATSFFHKLVDLLEGCVLTIMGAV